MLGGGHEVCLETIEEDLALGLEAFNESFVGAGAEVFGGCGELLLEEGEKLGRAVGGFLKGWETHD